MIQGRDIIVVGIQAWDIEIGSNCKNLACEFAKHNRVLYVNPPLVRFTEYRDKHNEKIQKRIRIKQGLEDGLVKIEDNLWNLYPKQSIESINWVPVHSAFKPLNKRNAKRFATDIKAAAEELEFKNFILFNDSSMFLGYHLKELLKPEVYAYYMRDYLVKVPYWQKHGEKIEPKTVKKADVVLTNSEFFEEMCSHINPHSYMVGQGCDISLFSDENDSIEIPEEIKDIPKPIIGYVGSLKSSRLDIDLIEYIAKQRKNWSIVLVGPEDENFKNSNLHNLDNVYFLGRKDESELPNYVKGFDVAINPQLANNLTIGNYPRKTDEYLAMGKPTLGTKTRAMEMFSDYVYLASSKEEYISLAEKALKEHSEELAKNRKEFAKKHTWENNVEAIYNSIIKATEDRILWN